MQGREYALVSSTEKKSCLKMMHVTFHWPGGSKSHAIPEVDSVGLYLPAERSTAGKESGKFGE